MVMGDALRALIDAVGLEVGPGEEIRSDDDRWTLDLDPDGTHAWVATRHRPVWLHRDDTLVFVEAGGAALVEQHPTTSIGSDPERHGPPRTAPSYDFPHEALFADTGVVVGSATLGPLAAEVLALPSIATTQPAGFPSADVVLALRHVGHLDGGRWHGVQQDALARLVVTTVLHDNPPPLLRDNSLARVLDRLFEPAGGHSTADLLDGVRMSPRTLERRCFETTGCTPAQLGRWFRSLGVRSALTRGDPPAEVAARFGFSTTASMRRALQRVHAPDTDLPRRF
ncbi:AraC-like DNA-binding protein [Curtobacterium sp. PhB25]|nr:AraC-like DNA-binding protein [Curtobacterium sp. PhB25]